MSEAPVRGARERLRPEGAAGLPYWNRDEWDVLLSDGGVYRIFRDRDTDTWFIDGIVD